MSSPLQRQRAISHDGTKDTKKKRDKLGFSFQSVVTAVDAPRKVAKMARPCSLVRYDDRHCSVKGQSHTTATTDTKEEKG